MTPTLANIKNWYNEFNKQVFNNELPTIPIKITNNRRQLGQFYWGNGRGIGIKISTYYDMPVDMFRNTVLHEMCHLYCYNKGFIREHHGKNWKAIAAYATRKTGLDITRCADISGIKPAKKNVEKQKAVEAKKTAPTIIIDLEYSDHHFIVKTTKNVLKSNDATDMNCNLRTNAKNWSVYICDGNVFKNYQSSRSIHRGYRYGNKEFELTMRPKLEKGIKVDNIRDILIGSYDCLGVR